MGGPVPKAFLLLGGRPLYVHSLETFLGMREVGEVVVVVPRGMKLPGTVQGGRRRQDSVLKGLRATDPSSDLVLIHDAARPFVTPELIRRVIRAADRTGGAVPGIPVGDTIKRVGRGSRVRQTLDRSELRAVQTPQGFRRSALVAAYAAGHGRRDATDDAQILERAGRPVAVVEGNPENFKITSRNDLIRAEDYFQNWRRPRTPRGTSRSARGAGP
jgi:2-C-methyl-D-erythritol 4-phosphate cytidylyltransferase